MGVYIVISMLCMLVGFILGWVACAICNSATLEDMGRSKARLTDEVNRLRQMQQSTKVVE